MKDSLSQLLGTNQTISAADATAIIDTIFATPPESQDDAKDALITIAALLVSTLTEPYTAKTDAFTFTATPMTNSTQQLVLDSLSLDIPVISDVAGISIITWTNFSDGGIVTSDGGISDGAPRNTAASGVVAIDAFSLSGTSLSISNLSQPFSLTWPSPPSTSQPENTTISCSYYNRTTLTWETDGCYTIFDNITATYTCDCYHLTEFALRFRAIARQNEQIFTSFDNVYSLEGLSKYKSIFILFSVIIATFILILCVLSRYDKYSYRKYSEYLNNISAEIGTYPFIDRMQIHLQPRARARANTTVEKKVEIPSTALKPSAGNLLRIWLNRTFYHHPYLSIFTRFDPRLPRVYRALFIFVLVCQSIFVTAFFYGYVTAVPDKMELSETITLSIITALINIPIMRFFYALMNRAGIYEFAWRYPHLFAELKRRHTFEHYTANIPTQQIVSCAYDDISIMSDNYLFDINSPARQSSNSSNTGNMTGTDSENITENLLVNLCRRIKSNTRPHIVALRHLRNIVNTVAPSTKQHVPWYHHILPFHTIQGAAACALPLVWIIWCINYLLLFSAVQSDVTLYNIFASYGISQVVAICLTNPISLCVSIIVGILISRIRLCTGRIGKIYRSPLATLSDPLSNADATALSADIGYWLFSHVPALISVRGDPQRQIYYASPQAFNGAMHAIMSATTLGANQSVADKQIRDRALIYLYNKLRAETILKGP
jgi:hypothetical protein